MKKSRAEQLQKLYGIALSLVLIAAGICLMAACLDIYEAGAGVFSREIVAEHFSDIAIPVYLCLAMVVLGFFLKVFLPGQNERVKPEKNYSLILQKLHEKTDLTLCDEELRAAIFSEQHGRKTRRITTLVLLAAGSIVFLWYALDGSHFHQQEITDSLIRAMWLLLPCILIPFAWAVFTAYSNRASLRREIDLLRQAGSNRSPAPSQVTKPGNACTYLRLAVLIVAVAILAYGYFSGGTADVLTKAINICTECVGLG